MKKFITLALLFNLSFIYANNDSIVEKAIKTEILDTSQLNFKEVYSDIKVGLKGLGDALKVGSEHVYEVVIKQQYILSITLLLAILIILIIGILSYKYASKKHNDFKLKNPNSSYDAWDEGYWCFGYIVSTILLVGGLIFTLATISTIITGFVNPEYGAINDIMNFIRK